MNRDVGDGYDPATDGKAPDHPGSLAVHEEAERQRGRERAAVEIAERCMRLIDEVDRYIEARDGAAKPVEWDGTVVDVEPSDATVARHADEALWNVTIARDQRRLAEASRRIAETGGGLVAMDRVPPTTQGYALPTPANVAEHAKPEMPRHRWQPDTHPDAADAADDDPLGSLRATLRTCRSLDQAASNVRRYAALVPGRLPPETLARLDRAERTFSVHYDERLRAAEMDARRHAIEALQRSGLEEFAAAMVLEDWSAILGGTA